MIAPVDLEAFEKKLRPIQGARGDVAAVVDELRRLREELAALRENAAGLLRDLEWVVRDPETLEGECPACHASEDDGHAVDCSLAAVLATIPEDCS